MILYLRTLFRSSEQLYGEFDFFHFIIVIFNSDFSLQMSILDSSLHPTHFQKVTGLEGSELPNLVSMLSP